jgi:hypothetical protein
MRHRGSRLRAVVAALLLALGAMFTAVGVASLTPSTADGSAASSRARHGAAARHDAFAPRGTSAPAKAAAQVAGLHLDLVAAVVALAAALLLLGWFVAGRARGLLPRLVTAPLGARAPPAFV